MASEWDEGGRYLGDLDGVAFKQDKERGKTLDGEEINGDHSWSAWVQ